MALPPRLPLLSLSHLSVPAALGDVAPAADADAAQAGGGAPEGPLPLPQHQAGQQPGLGLPPPGPRLQPVSSARG